LVLSNLSFGDEGEYQVEVSNVGGSVVSAGAKLTVLGLKPNIAVGLLGIADTTTAQIAADGSFASLTRFNTAEVIETSTQSGPIPAINPPQSPLVPSTHPNQRIVNYEYTCSDSRLAISGSCAATYGNSWAVLRSSNLKFGDGRGWHCAWDGVLGNPTATVVELSLQVNALCCTP
jgi:hypothetical protein